MKKLTTQTILVLLLAMTSLGSYIFLNTVEMHSASSGDETVIELDGRKPLERVESALPDVMLLKKLWKSASALYPPHKTYKVYRNLIGLGYAFFFCQ